MSKSSWVDNNSKYLGAALEWLRLKLQLYISGETAGPTQRKKESAARSSTEGTAQLAQQVTDAAEKMDKLAAAMKSAPALLLLTDALGLSPFERDVLLLSAAPEFDASIVDLYAEASRTAGLTSSRDVSTFALAFSLFEKPAYEALSPERPLRYWHLLEIDQPGSQPLTLSGLRVDERITDFLRGLNRLDDRLAPYLVSIALPESDTQLPASQNSVANKILMQWNGTGTAGSFPLMQLLGPDYASKQMIAANIAASLERELYRVSTDALPAQAPEIELLARIWLRENLLLPLVLLIDGQNIETPTDGHAGAARRFLARATGFLLLAVRDGWTGIAQESCSFDVAKPTREEQRAAWLSSLGSKQEDAAGLLSSQFNLNLPDIRRIAERSRGSKDSSSDLDQNLLWLACLSRVRPMLDSLARRIESHVTWEDIVLPEQEQRLLLQISAQVRERSRVYDEWGFSARMNRGLGISALFAGESGTGKTMAAEVIANELQLNLYRIDLSSVVSKYLGETEKNLCQLFDAAEDGGAILFFDEADALFGKRSEVKDSHDRYANIEINYLLQRMEAYSGLAILATNMRGAMDIAFTRRLRFIVNFPFPSIADRERMWQKAFPFRTPTHALDYRKLAKFNLTGGSISNAAVNAAFLAAHVGDSVGMRWTLAAIRQELIKLDRPVNENDFLWEEAPIQKGPKRKEQVA